MNKTFSRKLILILICFVVIVILAILLLVYKLKYGGSVNKDIGEDGEDFIKSYGISEDNECIDRQSYFDIQTCINQYLNIININSDVYFSYDNTGNKVDLYTEKEVNHQIYNLLSETYIKKNNITINNLKEKIKLIKESVIYIPLEMSLVHDSDIKVFVTHGILENYDYEYIEDIFLIVNIDVRNNIFSIIPIDDEYNQISEISNVDKEDVIVKNNNNQFNSSTSNYEKIIKDYINVYKRLALGKPELAYKFLDKEYREKRFGSESNFKKYIKNNKDEVIGINVSKFNVTEIDNYTKYECFDDNDFYYVFEEKSVMNFSITMDKHTIDTEDFIGTYNEAENRVKVGLNISKIVEALNMRDYSYVYSKFSNGFKKNYFKTEEEFEDYAKAYFKNINDVTFNEYTEQESGIYVYNITLKDKKGKSTLVLNTDVLMKLGEGTDFVISMSGLFPKVTYNGY